MKLNRIEMGRRVIGMVADFIHRKPLEVQLADNLRDDWNLTDKDFEVLELWIEGPISKSKKGFFQDTNTDVSVSDLKNPKMVKTIESLAELIWKCTPDENKTNGG